MFIFKITKTYYLYPYTCISHENIPSGFARNSEAIASEFIGNNKCLLITDKHEQMSECKFPNK